MEFVRIDVHKRENQVCIMTREGDEIEQWIRMWRQSFGRLLGK